MIETPGDTPDPPFPVRMEHLGSELSYLRKLVVLYPGLIEFKTGAGRLLNDLQGRLPDIAPFAAERRALCRRIAGAAYPLAARLWAQAVAVRIEISPATIMPPPAVAALSTYVAIDARGGEMLCAFLSQHEPDFDRARLTVPGGMCVLCEPINYHYHELHDDRSMRPRHAASNLPNRLERNVDPPPVDVWKDIYDTPVTPLLDEPPDGEPHTEPRQNPYAPQKPAENPRRRPPAARTPGIPAIQPAPPADLFRGIVAAATAVAAAPALLIRRAFTRRPPIAAPAAEIPQGAILRPALPRVAATIPPPAAALPATAMPVAVIAAGMPVSIPPPAAAIVTRENAAPPFPAPAAAPVAVAPAAQPAPVAAEAASVSTPPAPEPLVEPAATPPGMQTGEAEAPPAAPVPESVEPAPATAPAREPELERAIEPELSFDEVRSRFEQQFGPVRSPGEMMPPALERAAAPAFVSERIFPREIAPHVRGIGGTVQPTHNLHALSAQSFWRHRLEIAHESRHPAPYAPRHVPHTARTHQEKPEPGFSGGE